MELELSEGRVAGVQYHTVKPLLDYWWGTEPAIWNEMLTWCVDTYGPTPKDGVWTPSARWYSNNATFWFKEHKDLEWFIVRWS